MHVRYDGEVDAAHITIVNRIERGESVQQVVATPDDPGLGAFVLDLDREGRLLGVEVLRASHRFRCETLALASE
jgi:uncharacterized protein YuzE